MVAFASQSQATVFLDEKFDYSNGNLVGQGGWGQTGTSTTNPIQVLDNRAVLQATGQDAYKALSSTVPATAGTSLYTVFDLTLTSTQSTGDYFFHLSDPAGTTTNFYQRVYAKSSGSGFVLGLLDTSGTGSTITYGSTELSLSSLYTVTIQWNFIEGANNDTFSMYVGSSLYLNHSWTSVTAEPLQLAAVNLRQGSNTAAPAGTVDSILVTDVNPIPEPSTYALLLAGVGLVFWTLRRKRQTA